MTDLPRREDGTFYKYVDGKQIIFDATSLDRLFKCQTYYKYKVDGWEKVGSDRSSLVIGLAIHEGSDVAQKMLHNGATPEEALFAGMASAVEKWGSEILASKESFCSIETLFRSLTWKLDRDLASDLETVTLPDGAPAVEFRFDVPIPHTPYRVAGKVDRMVSSPSGIYPLDIKVTKSKLTDHYFSSYKPSVQTLVYMWALKKMLGLDVKGIIIDGVQIGVSYTEFARHTVTISDSLIEEFERDMVAELNRYDANMAAGKLEHRWTSCNLYGGCEFKHVCGRDLSVRQMFLEGGDFVCQPYTGAQAYVTEDSDG